MVTYAYVLSDFLIQKIQELNIKDKVLSTASEIRENILVIRCGFSFLVGRISFDLFEDEFI